MFPGVLNIVFGGGRSFPGVVNIVFGGGRSFSGVLINSGSRSGVVWGVVLERIRALPVGRSINNSGRVGVSGGVRDLTAGIRESDVKQVLGSL